MRPDDFEEEETELMVNCMAYPDHPMCGNFREEMKKMKMINDISGSIRDQ